MAGRGTRRAGWARIVMGSLRRWVVRRLAVLTAVLAVLAAGLLGGCSAGSGVDAMSADGDDAGGGVAAPEETAGGDTGARRAAVQTRQVIATGRVTLAAEDLDATRADVQDLLARFGGYVAEEDTRHDDAGATERSTLRLRVPSQHFDRVMAAFEDVATLVDSGRSTVDVTTEVIDVDARIRTQEVSLRRLRGFLGKAADVEAMIRLESEIAEREADLASLRAQQEHLEDQTSLATVTVTLVPTAAAEPGPLDEAGFLTGLRTGWDALTGAFVVGATALGVVLPFSLVAGLVVVPLWWGVRSHRRRTPALEPGPTE